MTNLVGAVVRACAQLPATLQIRCVTCDALIAEGFNIIEAGYAMLEPNCGTCGRCRLEIVGWLDRA
jgi:hypothetical protein